MTLRKLVWNCLLALGMVFAAASAVMAQDTVTYYHSDVVGSPIAATDEYGNLLWREEYAPYGERLRQENSARSNGMWFTGHHQDDDSGLIYAGARHYDPFIARFTSTDPAGLDATNPFSFNRYAYGNDSPFRFADPGGNVPLDTIWDVGNVAYDLGKITVGWTIGNQFLVVEGTKDLALDFAATLIPYVPAGSSKVARATARAAEKAVEKGQLVAKEATAAKAGAQAAVDANKLVHIFGNARHNLGPLVQKLGSQEATFSAVQNAAQAAVRNQSLSGVFQTTVNVAGQNVVVRGNVIDGVARIGTFFVP